MAAQPSQTAQTMTQPSLIDLPLIIHIQIRTVLYVQQILSFGVVFDLTEKDG